LKPKHLFIFLQLAFLGRNPLAHFVLHVRIERNLDGYRVINAHEKHRRKISPHKISGEVPDKSSGIIVIVKSDRDSVKKPGYRIQPGIGWNLGIENQAICLKMISQTDKFVDEKKWFPSSQNNFVMILHVDHSYCRYAQSRSIEPRSMERIHASGTCPLTFVGTDHSRRSIWFHNPSQTSDHQDA
jgi:hypothetical protein